MIFHISFLNYTQIPPSFPFVSLSNYAYFNAFWYPSYSATTATLLTHKKCTVLPDFVLYFAKIFLGRTPRPPFFIQLSQVKYYSHNLHKIKCIYLDVPVYITLLNTCVQVTLFFLLFTLKICAPPLFVTELRHCYVSILHFSP